MAVIDSVFSFLSKALGEVAAGLHLGPLAENLTDKAKATWNAQTPMTQGAIAGGAIALLLSGNARRLLSAGAEVGGAALIGGLAMKAYAEWQADKEAAAAAAVYAATHPAPYPDDLAHRLLQAMVAAAKADEVITAEERAALERQVARLGLGEEADLLIMAEMEAPADAARIAALARTPHEAAGLYTASLLVVDRKGVAERAYLAALAAALGLDRAQVRRLEANVPHLA
jgi:uncharacterized membrane protein YebE (DUF533 family)